MVIRCERCSTLYELDEGLLAPGGSPVQCTKCQHVFTARPPGTSAEAKASASPPSPTPGSSPRASPEPAAGRPAAEAWRSPAAPPDPEAFDSAAPAAPRSTVRTDAPPTRAVSISAVERDLDAERGARGETSAARAPRSGPPPVYRAPVLPSAGGGGGMGRPPLLHRDAVGTFEARLRWSARWRWLAPSLAVLLLVAAGAAWYLFSRRAASGPSARAASLALAARDDAASLDAALARLDEAVRKPDASRLAAADRALVQVLRAAAVAEEGEALAARHAALEAERERTRREQPDGWEATERAAADEARDAEAGARAQEDRSRALAASALEALRALGGERGDAPEVARALAAYHALGGDRARAEEAVRMGRGAAPEDPWLTLVDGWLDSSAPDRGARERALVKLGGLSTAHPEIMRGRHLLARTLASLGQRGDARVTAERLLADNPQHEGAKRLLAELDAPSDPSREGADPEERPGLSDQPPSAEHRPGGNDAAAPGNAISPPLPGAPAASDGPVPPGTPAPAPRRASSPREGEPRAPAAAPRDPSAPSQPPAGAGEGPATPGARQRSTGVPAPGPAAPIGGG